MFKHSTVIKRFNPMFDSIQQPRLTHIKQSSLRAIITLLIVLLCASCNRPECKNTNEIFNKFTPDNEEYKKELAAEMQRVGMDNLRYWFDKPVVVEGKHMVEVYIQGSGLCAKGQLFPGDKTKQLPVSNSTGGYHGAELKNVEIRILGDSSGTNFILEQVGKIID